jgi:glycosyltransferase involved in cell wall biosynthesis
MTKKVLAVVPTFNRGDIINLTSAYLRRIPFAPDRFSFLISDDCSTEYGLGFLREAYSQLPNATIMRTSRNAGAAAHVWVLLRFFVESEYEKILVLDSDLIAHEGCLRAVEDFDPEPVSSLYNSCFHKVVDARGSYCTKADIGWAGALIDRGVVRELFELHGSSLFDDWALCELVWRRGLAIKVATPSVIEHIGVSGANNVVPEYFDHSLDFPREHIDQPTRDYFLHRRGFDLLRQLDSRPEHSAADDLRVFRIEP